MTQGDDIDALSPSRTRLAGALENREFRESFLEQHVAHFLADQIRTLRGDMSQQEFGELIGKPQSVVSRLENQNYGKANIQTLLDIAHRLGIAVIVQFVDYPTFLEMAERAPAVLAPQPYDAHAVADALRATHTIEGESPNAAAGAPGRLAARAESPAPNIIVGPTAVPPVHAAAGAGLAAHLFQPQSEGPDQRDFRRLPALMYPS